mgnify:CR=1 FL=1
MPCIVGPGPGGPLCAIDRLGPAPDAPYRPSPLASDADTPTPDRGPFAPAPPLPPPAPPREATPTVVMDRGPRPGATGAGPRLPIDAKPCEACTECTTGIVALCPAHMHTHSCHQEGHARHGRSRRGIIAFIANIQRGGGAFRTWKHGCLLRNRSRRSGW